MAAMMARDGKLAVLRNRLSRLMGERRIGIKAVAEGSGVSYRAVFDLYHDKSQRVDLGTLNRLCNFFQVPVGEILEWTPDPAGAD